MHALRRSIARASASSTPRKTTTPFSLRSRAPAVRAMASAKAPDGTKLDKNTPEAVWRGILTPEEYHVLRQKGTERPGTGVYNKHYEEGTYVCAGCGTPLFKSDFKFNSGCGWPAFWDEIPGSVDRHVDDSMGMRRTEITCSACGGHLGHEFLNEGFPNPKPIRHCVNSVSIKFEAAADK